MVRWRPVPGFEAFYEVSDLGRVRSLDRLIVCVRAGKTHSFVKPGALLSVYYGEQGHVQVSLWAHGRKVTRWVHALVLTTFEGPAPPKFECRHKNGDPSDNRLDNLTWASKGRNNQDRKWHKGGKNYKLKPDDVVTIRRLLSSGTSHRRIATMYNVTKSTITAINLRKFHIDV